MVEEVKKISKSEDGTVTTVKTTKTIKKIPAKKKSGGKDLSSSKPKKMTAKQREELLIENFVGLQKAMTNLSVKFEGLSTNIARLLEVFELSARDQLEKSPKEDDKDLLRKIDNLLDQNKTIARGLILIEEKVRDRSPVYPPHEAVPYQVPQQAQRPQNNPSLRNKPLPRI